jgi:hypothetical protein
MEAYTSQDFICVLCLRPVNDMAVGTYYHTLAEFNLHPNHREDARCPYYSSLLEPIPGTKYVQNSDFNSPTSMLSLFSSDYVG